MMPSALQLFAEGRLPRVDGDPVEVAIGGRKLGSMVLTEVRCEFHAAMAPAALRSRWRTISLRSSSTHKTRLATAPIANTWAKLIGTV
jgi:hypothetical protein